MRFGFGRGGHRERNALAELTALVRKSVTTQNVAERIEGVVTIWPGYLATRKVEISLPGDPPFTITNDNLSCFYLPWRVKAGSVEWTTTDVRLTRALAPFLWNDSTFDEFVAKWRDEVWDDITLWQGIDTDTESTLCRRLYGALRGYAEASSEWCVEDATCAQFALMPGETLFLDLRANASRAVNTVRGYVPIVDGRVSSDWNDFLRAVERAEATVGARPWLVDWKSAGGERSIELQLVGASAIHERDPAVFVQPAWRMAGFEGEPEVEIVLRREAEWAATAFLAGADSRGLVLDSNQRPGPHWLDALELHFHPRSREFAYVDAEGAHHVVR